VRPLTALTSTGISLLKTSQSINIAAAAAPIGPHCPLGIVTVRERLVVASRISSRVLLESPATSNAT
jgi:hypothetical protein